MFCSFRISVEQLKNSLDSIHWNCSYKKKISEHLQEKEMHSSKPLPLLYAISCLDVCKNCPLFKPNGRPRPLWSMFWIDYFLMIQWSNNCFSGLGKIKHSRQKLALQICLLFPYKFHYNILSLTVSLASISSERHCCRN